MNISGINTLEFHLDISGSPFSFVCSFLQERIKVPLCQSVSFDLSWVFLAKFNVHFI